MQYLVSSAPALSHYFCPHTTHLVHMQQRPAHSWPGMCSHLTFTLIISVYLSILVLGNTLLRFLGDSTILKTRNIRLLTIWGGAAPPQPSARYLQRQGPCPLHVCIGCLALWLTVNGHSVSADCVLGWNEVHLKWLMSHTQTYY